MDVKLNVEFCEKYTVYGKKSRKVFWCAVLYRNVGLWYICTWLQYNSLREADELDENLKYLLVETKVLPEVFLKVIQAKILLSRGKAGNASQAAQMAGISRSAFYKYKDSLFLYDERMNENIVSFYLTLEDRPGVLSNLLTEFSRLGANVVTVNQNIPVDGVAIASVSVRTADASRLRSQVSDVLGMLDGVVEVKAV